MVKGGGAKIRFAPPPSCATGLNNLTIPEEKKFSEEIMVSCDVICGRTKKRCGVPSLPHSADAQLRRSSAGESTVYIQFLFFIYRKHIHYTYVGYIYIHIIIHYTYIQDTYTYTYNYTIYIYRIHINTYNYTHTYTLYIHRIHKDTYNYTLYIYRIHIHNTIIPYIGYSKLDLLK